MRIDRDEYDEIYKLDMRDEWINSAYDENGDISVCDICGGEMKWNMEHHEWYCPDCGQIMNRIQYFNHIGANPPGCECITNCCENYPFCKKYCLNYNISPDDPMLT